jgi:hypothetical protein
VRSWRRLKAELAYKREKRKKKTASEPHPEFAGFCLVAVSALGLYCTLWPHNAGVAGAITGRALLRGIGESAVVMWGLLSYRGVLLILRHEDRQPWRFLLVDLLLLVALCAFLSGFTALAHFQTNLGGALGKATFGVFEQLLGFYGGLFLAFVTVAAFALWRSGRGPRDVIQFLTTTLVNDWREWRSARSIEQAKTAAPVPKKPLPKVKPSSAPATSPALSAAEKPVVKVQ